MGREPLAPLRAAQLCYDEACNTTTVMRWHAGKEKGGSNAMVCGSGVGAIEVY